MQKQWWNAFYRSLLSQNRVPYQRFLVDWEVKLFLLYTVLNEVRSSLLLVYNMVLITFFAMRGNMRTEI